MLDVSDVRIYGIGAIILILSMGYFVYLLYQDVTFLKKEVQEYKTIANHSYTEDRDDYDEEGSDDQEYADFVENCGEESLESHLDSFMRPHEMHHLHTIKEVEEPATEDQVIEEPQIKKRRGRKQKTEIVCDSEPVPELNHE